MTTGFDAHVRLIDEVAVIDLIGEINNLAGDRLEAAYSEVHRNDKPVVLLNFKDVEYINSSGIALIVTLLARARSDDRTVSSCNLSDHYNEIFVITRVTDFMTVYPDESSALAGSRPDGASQRRQ